MSDKILELHALAPLLLRDGRPFAGGGEESRAQSLAAPLPQTVAGLIRTQLGNAQAVEWQALSDDDLHKKLQDLHTKPVRSVFMRDKTFVFPKPENAVMDKVGKVYRSSPGKLEQGEGVNFSAEGLRPLLLDKTPENFKPEGGYRYFNLETMQQWLAGKTPATTEKIGDPPTEERTHVAIDSSKGVGEEGLLFSVAYRSFEARDEAGYHRWTLRIKTGFDGGFAPVGHLGGERRPVALKDVGTQAQWPNIGMFPEVEKALATSNKLCFVLTSPAIFKNGWQPGWLDLTAEDAAAHNGNGLPAGVKQLAGKVKLVGAAVGRRIPVSGWSVRDNKPKSVRWAVPAGSVYFFEVTGEIDRAKLKEAWLKPLSDNINDQRDGFGCALWGVW